MHNVCVFYFLALLRRATVYNHMGKFQMASEDLRMVLREEPHNTAATVGNRMRKACSLTACGPRCLCICM